MKEHTKDILSEDALNEIESAFDEAVTQKAGLHVEAALAQQDEDHAQKVQKLLEAVDDDHTKKLQHIVGAINENHALKLKAVLKKFGNNVDTEASEFKNTLLESISNYLDLGSLIRCDMCMVTLVVRA